MAAATPRPPRCNLTPPLRLLPPFLCSYASFIESLEACSRDNLEFVKDRAVKTM